MVHQYSLRSWSALIAWRDIPAFTYNAAVFPAYGDTKHHWYITTPDKHVSLITDSKEDLLYDIDNAFGFKLHFVPLPETL